MHHRHGSRKLPVHQGAGAPCAHAYAGLMTTQRPGAPDEAAARNEQFWRDYLVNYSRAQAAARPIFSRLPSAPRCQLCGSPFEGFGGRLMKAVGKAQSAGSPRLCNQCEKVMLEHHGGAEVPGSMLFADIRGSTALAERMTPGEFHALLDRFSSVASATVFAHNGFVDKFVGDEVVAVFAPVLGGDHAKRAVDAGIDLLRSTGHADPSGPWAPVGAGVHTGLPGSARSAMGHMPSSPSWATWSTSPLGLPRRPEQGSCSSRPRPQRRPGWTMHRRTGSSSSRASRTRLKS